MQTEKRCLRIRYASVHDQTGRRCQNTWRASERRADAKYCSTACATAARDQKKTLRRQGKL
jgi:hypothetical protein